MIDAVGIQAFARLEQLLEAVDVASGAEVFACSADEDRADLGVVLHPGDAFLDLVELFGGERVADLRAVLNGHDDIVVLVVFHVRSPVYRCTALCSVP